MRRPTIKRAPHEPSSAPLTRVERLRRSREALVTRTMALVIAGHSLAAISRRPHMPHHGTFKRWLSQDSVFRARYEAARLLQMHVMADEVVALADRFAASTRGRRHTAAVKLQIEARKWRLKTFADNGQKDERRGTKRGGLTDSDIAVLEAAQQQVQRDAGAPAETTGTEVAEGTSRRMDEVAATMPEVFKPGGSDSARNADGQETDAPGDPADPTPEEPQPNSFVPRFDDDLRPPERPYDPLTW
jgi:hypothetical protein